MPPFPLPVATTLSCSGNVGLRKYTRNLTQYASMYSFCSLVLPRRTVLRRFLHCVKFIYSEKATKFCKTSPLLLSVCTVDKSKEEISQNFVAFTEYTTFNIFRLGQPYLPYSCCCLLLNICLFVVYCGELFPLLNVNGKKKIIFFFFSFYLKILFFY